MDCDPNPNLAESFHLDSSTLPGFNRSGAVVTDLGAGPELARVAVGGVLNPAEVCVVLSDGGWLAELAAARIEEACRQRDVSALRVLNRRGEPEAVAAELLAELRG